MYAFVYRYYPGAATIDVHMEPLMRTCVCVHVCIYRYYPGAATIDFKLLFDPKTGSLLGCQAVGEAEGVEKRVDVVSAFLQKGGTVFDLEEAELCYAPQYGSAKDVSVYTHAHTQTHKDTEREG